MTQTNVNDKLPVADFGPDHPFTGAAVISSYTRQAAIEDGVLIDITHLARRRGFRFDVACTDRLWESLISLDRDPDTADLPTLERRQGQVLNCLLMAIKALGSDRTDYASFTILTDKGNAKAWAKCHPDDDGDPCITIMLQGED